MTTGPTIFGSRTTMEGRMVTSPPSMVISMPDEVIITSSGDVGRGTSAVEIVERKGIGHPDTIADSIAERFSHLYSTYSMAQFGDVAHHWVDKTMAIGGEAEIGFGVSRPVAPIRVFIVGKATKIVGTVEIPTE